MDVPLVLTRSRLRSAGYTDGEVRRQLRSGELVALRRDCYLRGPLPDEPELRHAVAAHAVAEHIDPGAAFSHITAVVLHGLPVWRTCMQQVHVTRRAGVPAAASRPGCTGTPRRCQRRRSAGWPGCR
ncbi:MAG TPA: hypothetical protein VNA11_00030 [Pseudonocardia sp.]|nr:hypothetical protein [Pseudonocardia sp.]